jgi:hypothetical protein
LPLFPLTPGPSPNLVETVLEPLRPPLGLWKVCLKIRLSEAVAIARRLVLVDPVALVGGAVEAEPVFELELDPSDSELLVPIVRAVGVADLERETMAGLSRTCGFEPVGVISSEKSGMCKLAEGSARISASTRTK